MDKLDRLFFCFSFLAAVNEAAQMFKMERTTMPLTISKNYGINEEDARLWFKGVNIVAHRFVSQTALETASTKLILRFLRRFARQSLLRSPEIFGAKPCTACACSAARLWLRVSSDALVRQHVVQHELGLPEW